MMYNWLFSLIKIAIFISFSFGCYLHIPLFTSPKEWSYFVLAQRWPPAACLSIPSGKCSIPEGVDDWIIHGLWPSSDVGYPSFCNSSWPFNPKSIISILHEMEVKWPNIYANTSENKFWKHEWLKHGTCAANLSDFDTELKYFKRTLTLHDDLNIYEFLRRSGINPSENNPYLLKTIENAITLHLNKTVKLFCENHKHYSYPLLSGIYICLDKNIQLIDCDKVHERTCNETNILYLPFNKTVSVKLI